MLFKVYKFKRSHISFHSDSQPFDLVKVRLQTSHGLYKNTFDCFKQIIAKDGVFGLYRGMATPLASITPIFAVSFWVRGIDFQYV